MLECKHSVDFHWQSWPSSRPHFFLRRRGFDVQRSEHEPTTSKGVSPKRAARAVSSSSRKGFRRVFIARRRALEVQRRDSREEKENTHGTRLNDANRTATETCCSINTRLSKMWRSNLDYTRLCKESRTGIRGVSPFCSFESQEDAKLSRVQTVEREGNKMNERAINAYAGNASARKEMGRPVTTARTTTG
jgi:hypothetical protein